MESTPLTARIQDIDYNHQDEIMLKFRSLFTGLALFGALFAAPAMAIDVFSEDFEAFSPYVALGGFQPLPASGPTGVPVALNIHDWFVTGSVDLVRELTPGANSHGAINSVSVDLSGSPGPGTLSRTFSSMAGTAYTLAFDYFKNSPGTTLTLGFLGSISSLDAVALGTVGHHVITLTAGTSGPSLLSFSGGGGFGGPTIDNIVLTAVPEPSPIAFMAVGLLLIVFLSRRRLNRN